jgi:hypothetical protein
MKFIVPSGVGSARDYTFMVLEKDIELVIVTQKAHIRKIIT